MDIECITRSTTETPHRYTNVTYRYNNDTSMRPLALSSCPPSHMNLIGAETMNESVLLHHRRSQEGSPLCACALRERRFKAHPEAQEAGLCYHDAVVDAEPEPGISVMNPPISHIARSCHIPLVRGEDVPSALPGHNTHHLLQPFIAYIAYPIQFRVITRTLPT